MAVALNSDLIRLASGNAESIDSIKSSPTDAAPGIRVIDPLIRASATDPIDSVIAIGTDTALRTVDLELTTNVIASLASGIVDGTVCALLASVVDDEEARVAVASAVLKLAVCAAERLALKDLEVVVETDGAFVADSVDPVEAILAEAGSVVVVFVFTANWHAFLLRVEGVAVLTFRGDAATFGGFVTGRASRLTETVE